MLISSHIIKRALRFAGSCALVFASLQSMCQKNELHGEATTYMSIHSAKQISGLGYASIYNHTNFWQVRYNYEDQNTVSFLWGKPFSKQKKFFVEAIPTIGLSVGNFIGVSPAVQLYAENGQFEFFSSNQTSFCITDIKKSFFFNWTEALFKFRDIVKVGAAFQYTKGYPAALTQNKEVVQQEPAQLIDVGPLVGFQYKKFYLSGYFFNLWQPQRHYAVSLTYNFR